MIQELLNHIKEDKTDNPITTSFKFKEDFYNYFNKDEFKDALACEFGTHKGQTTHIMSHLFKHVYTINKKQSQEALNINKNQNNISFIEFNLESSLALPIPKCKVFFIDAIHKYNNVISDINRCFFYGTEQFYIVFDDYGLYEDDVKKPIQKFIQEGKLKICTFIGHKEDYSFTENKKLKDWEGIILTNVC